MHSPAKIAIVGPESTGKSTLAEQLAVHYESVWVPEYARAYLDELGRAYEQKDLVDIAKGQLASEAALSSKANTFLFCDTNLLVIKVWSEFVYGECDPWILENMQLPTYSIYFLTDIDIPWEYDPLREHPYRRQELWRIYSEELKKAGVEVVDIRGSQEERLATAIKVLEEL